MYIDEKRIKELLMQKNETFKDLDLKHQQFDRQLNEIKSRSTKTETDLIEERNIKKQKLKIKDSMQQFIFEYRRNEN